MTFGEIFEKTWVDYKNNFKSIFIFMLIFIGVFLLISNLVSFVWFFSNEGVREVMLNPYLTENDFSVPWQYLVTTWILGIIGFLLYLFIDVGLIGISVKKSKFRFNEIIRIGVSSYFKYIAFTIVLIIFLAGLFLLLIIPGIIFMVYWAFGVYVLYDEKKDIFTSLKRSRELVRGRWWRVFGYFILVFLILFAVSVIISSISLPIQMIIINKIIDKESLSLGFLIFSSLLNIISNFLANLIHIPFLILFGKNFYFELKENEKKSK